MCFRPSPVKKHNSSDAMGTCETCGMPFNADDVAKGTCSFCGDPIPANPPDEFSNIDPSYSTRII